MGSNLPNKMMYLPSFLTLIHAHTDAITTKIKEKKWCHAKWASPSAVHLTLSSISLLVWTMCVLWRMRWCLSDNPTPPTESLPYHILYLILGFHSAVKSILVWQPPAQFGIMSVHEVRPPLKVEQREQYVLSIHILTYQFFSSAYTWSSLTLPLPIATHVFPVCPAPPSNSITCKWSIQLSYLY